VLARSSVICFFISATYPSSCSFVYLCVSCYCHACFKFTALRVGVKTLNNAIREKYFYDNWVLHGLPREKSGAPGRSVFLYAFYHNRICSFIKHLCKFRKRGVSKPIRLGIRGPGLGSLFFFGNSAGGAVQDIKF